MHINEWFFLFAYSLPVFTRVLPRCWIRAKNKYTGRMIF
jgi:hypothetical protein